LPAFSAHTIRFHRGYNLYNIGFALGVLSMLFAVILHSFNVKLDVGGPTTEAYHSELVYMSLGLSLIFLISAFIFDPKVIKKYPELLKSSGRLVSDFITDYGKAVSMLNVAVMGFISVGMLLLLGLEINGPVMGGILTVMGFGAFGKHPRNAIPVMFGAWLGVVLTNYSLDSVGMVIALLFVTAVSPIAGRYGPFIGIIAGFIHILITPLAYAFQGGFDLYNNGFAAGFVAALMIPLLEALSKNKKLEVQNE
jgi:MFS family permease